MDDDIAEQSRPDWIYEDDETLHVSIVYQPDQAPHDQRPREIQINKYKLPRVGEYITWNDHPNIRSKVIEVHHGFPSGTGARHAHPVTLVVEDVSTTD